jgi:hypothetical protein
MVCRRSAARTKKWGERGSSCLHYEGLRKFLSLRSCASIVPT